MTENKRFTVDYDITVGNYCLHDKQKAKGVDGYIAYMESEERANHLCNLLNILHEENQLLKEEKELLKNKLDRIEDILPHFLSCAEISEFRGKTVKEDLALMKCWNKRYQK